MATRVQKIEQCDSEPVATSVFVRARRATMAQSVAALLSASAAGRSESRIAVLTDDQLLAFAVTALATAHFPSVTVMRPEIEDIRAARHLDSRSHALLIVDGALLSSMGTEALGSWLRPFRGVPMLLLTTNPGTQSLDQCLHVVPVPRDVTPRSLAEAIRHGLQDQEKIIAERRPRPQAIERITATQWRVIGYLGAGHSNKEIAYRMGISEATVKAHVGAAIAKLGLTNRTEVALFSQRLSLGARWAKIAGEVEAPV